MRFSGQAASSGYEVTAFNARERYDNAISGLIRTVERLHKVSVKRSAVLAAPQAFNPCGRNIGDDWPTSYCEFRACAEFAKITALGMAEIRV